MTRALSSYPGFRFSPTEEELVLYYLKRKIEGVQKCDETIAEIDFTKHEPWELPEKSIISSYNEWYFFTTPGRRYPNGSQSKRGTDSGYWKVTGLVRNVKSGTRIVGTKKTLVFHKGRAPKGTRTEWIMHEYCMRGAPQESFVVCRIKNCEYNPSDIPPNEMNETLTEETTTAVVDIQQTNVFDFNEDMVEGFTPPNRCNNPHPVERFESDSEYEKESGSLVFQHSTNCFDYESDKKAGNLYFQDESCSLPKGFEGLADDYFDNILYDDIFKLDKSSLLSPDLPGKDTLNDDFTGFKYEQPNESFPPPTLPFQGTAPRRIRLKLHQRIRPKNLLPFHVTAPLRIRHKTSLPLPFQGTAPRRIRMMRQHIDNPVHPEELRKHLALEMKCILLRQTQHIFHVI